MARGTSNLAAAMTLAALAANALFAATALAGHDKSMAILGDSVATGAVASERVDAQVTSLLTNFFRHGLSDPEGSAGGVNYPENAFSQITATGFGVRPDRVYNMAVNGERVNSIASQFQKLMTVVPTVPNYLLVSFTANDACSEEIFSTPIETFREKYLRSLLEGDNAQAGLRYVVRAAPSDRDTSLFLLASLNFPQVLTNPSILNREVPLHFSTVRCERFRSGLHKDGPRMSYITDKLIQVTCPAVLGTDPNGTDETSTFRRQHLQKIHSAMIAAQAEAIAILQTENKNPRLKLHFVGSPAQIAFDGRHVANDCFHLSNQGQGRLGMTAWEEIFDGL